MKIIFAGTPPFAASALEALDAAGHDIALVLTQPDRPAGRGMKLSPSPVSVVATSLGLRLEKFASLRLANAATNAHTSEIQREAAIAHSVISSVDADVMVVAAYGLILPQAVLDMPRLGCLNIHGSLLPRWRGAAPVQRAIEAGDTETGVGIMQMEAGLDTGPVLLEKRLPISEHDTSATLFERLAKLGAIAIVEALVHHDKLIPLAQPSVGMTYAKKIEKSEAHIDWNQDAVEIARRIRAFDPFPGCEVILDHSKNEKLKIWRAVTVNIASSAKPGLVIDISDADFTVACGGSGLALKVLTVQRAGGKRISTAQWLNFATSTTTSAGTTKPALITLGAQFI